MTLKSMLLQALVSRPGGLESDEADMPFFGVYLRFVPGSFATQSQAVEEIISINQCVVLFLTETILKLTHALAGELKSCSSVGVVRVPINRERLLVSEITNIIRPSESNDSQGMDLEDLMRWLSREIRCVRDYVSRQLFGENRDYEGVFLSVDDLKSICRVTTSTYLEKPETTVYFLLDEFENLLVFQKVVANSILKASESGHYSVKIAVMRQLR